MLFMTPYNKDGKPTENTCVGAPMFPDESALGHKALELATSSVNEPLGTNSLGKARAKEIVVSIRRALDSDDQEEWDRLETLLAVALAC